MTILRRDGFVSALRNGVLWYAGQDSLAPEDGVALADKFASAMDAAIANIADRPAGGVRWPYREGYRFRMVRKPFNHWLIFYRQPTPNVVELVDLIRGERELPRRVH